MILSDVSNSEMVIKRAEELYEIGTTIKVSTRKEKIHDIG